MKQQDIRVLKTEQLLAKREEMLKEQHNLRFQKATGQLDKPHRVQEVRKDIARLNTELSARQKTVPTQKGKSAHA